MKKCMIIANGKMPRRKQIEFLKEKGYSTIIAADGGANSLYRLQIVPDIIIGDLDSARQDVLKAFSAKSEVIQLERQNDTDVEKSLKHALRHGFKKVILMGVIGDRLDHSFCNLSIALKYSETLEIMIIHDRSILSVISGQVKLNTRIGETISIFAFDNNTFITSHGLKYPLKNETLAFGQRESTSNCASKKEVELIVEGGKAFLVREYIDAVKHDNF